MSVLDTQVEIAIRRLRDAVLNGVWKPSEIRTLDQLKNLSGVGTTPTRDGVRSLCARQLLKAESRGYRVNLLDDADVEQFIFIRCQMEPKLASRAAEVCASVAGVNKPWFERVKRTLETYVHRQRTAIEKAFLLSVIFNCISFHRAIAKAALYHDFSTWFGDYLDRFHVRLLWSAKQADFDLMKQELMEDALQHEHIGAAIIAGDKKLAEKLMHDHLEYANSKLPGWLDHASIGGTPENVDESAAFGGDVIFLPSVGLEELSADAEGMISV